MSAITFVEDYPGFKLTFKSITKKVFKQIITEYNHKQGDISVVFMSDDELLEINKQYLQHDYYTDIITFDYTEGDIVSGDLLISIDMIKFNAEKFAVDFEVELKRVMCHGLFHLLGLKDKSEEDILEMRNAENAALLLF